MDINTRHEMGTEESSSKGSQTPQKKGRGGLVFLILLIIVAAVLFGLDRMGTINLLPSSEEQEQKQVDEFIAQTGAWHAVFLTNGQVYFGQLSNPEGTYVELKDVYYLQVQQGATTPAAPAPTGTGSQVVPAPQPEPPRLTLIKFGTELHRPMDWMKINRDQVLFWEELSSESAVVQAIKQYKETQAAGGQ